MILREMFLFEEFAVLVQYLRRLSAALGCDGDVGLGSCGAGGGSGWHWWRGFLVSSDAR